MGGTGSGAEICERIPAGGGSRMQNRRPEPSRHPKARRRSPVKSVLLGFYKFLVAVSALIVAVFIGFRLMVQPPDQSQSTLPSQVGNQTDSTGGAGSDTEDENALVRRDLVYNVLLAATDNGSTRTDTMMVMSYDIPNQKVGSSQFPGTPWWSGSRAVPSWSMAPAVWSSG